MDGILCVSLFNHFRIYQTSNLLWLAGISWVKWGKHLCFRSLIYDLWPKTLASVSRSTWWRKEVILTTTWKLLWKRQSEITTSFPRGCGFLTFYRLVSMVSHIPWATKFMTYVVNPGGRGLKIRELSGRMVGQRLKSDSVTRDLFYHLVRHLSLSISIFLH